jgi:hypothetical protein
MPRIKRETHEVDERRERTRQGNFRVFRLFRVFGVLSFSVFIYFLSCAASFSANPQNQKPLTGYKVIVVDKTAVDQSPATAKLPAGFDLALQQQIIERFKDDKLFDEVIDGTIEDENRTAPPPPAPPAAGKRLVLSISIIEFDPGNKALRRTIGFGAGATKVKIRFVFRDASSNRELFTTTQQGKFWGFVEVFGSGRNHAVTEASGDVIDGLIREINKNR